MKRFFGFKGRMRRRDYLLWILGLYIAAILTVWLLGWPLVALYVWLFIAQAVKRLHDVDLSGWWVLLFLLAFAAGLVPSPLDKILMLPVFGLQLGLWFKRGTVGENQYGPDPLNPIALSNVQLVR